MTWITRIRADHFETGFKTPNAGRCSSKNPVESALMTAGLRYRAVLFDLDGTLVDSDHFLERFADLIEIVRREAA